MDLTEELYNYANKYEIKLIGEYEKVKKTTPIFYSCYQCGIQIKKSYKTLTKYKDSPYMSACVNNCNRCIKIMFY